MSISVRLYEPKDRDAVRQIAFDTALAGKPGSLFFDGEDFLKDALTLYFTDHEPDHIWVAVKDGVVVGYVTGAQDESVLRQVHVTKIWPHLLIELLRSGILFSKKNWVIFLSLLRGALQGEFRMPAFADDYPSILHINLVASVRGQGVGALLLGALVDSFASKGCKGVRLATMSRQAMDFFVRNGFKLLHEGHRSYLKDALGETFPVYILGRRLSQS